ncbi:MAG TPA: glycosyltransferase family 39 protein, partial [Pseudomonadales bacterium]|nr:glycosyltransferase family 39 protein [Pseudomonadales bacterium]
MRSSPTTWQWREKLNLWLLAVLIIGAALRFYHLGFNSFWLDEAGVAYAAGAGSLAKMLEVVRSHVLAMPLDYFVVWVVGRFSLQEATLRIPAALWGVGSLYLAYRLYRKLVSPVPALFALLVLALSPLHIQYSQELRFYSSLVFFYLLTSLLLWDALQEPSSKRWSIFLIASITGIYFHPYVIFAFMNGLFWLALQPQKGARARTQRTAFLFCAILSLLAFLIGYLTFSASNTFKIPLMVFEDSPVEAIAIGIGWLPFYPGPPGLSWIWGITCAAFEIIGIITVLKTERRSALSGIFYSILLQLSAVLGADLLQHYFFAPRQLLMLLPLLCLFAGVGIETAIYQTVHVAAKIS